MLDFLSVNVRRVDSCVLRIILSSVRHRMSSPVTTPAEDLLMVEFVAYRQQHRRAQLGSDSKQRGWVGVECVRGSLPVAGSLERNSSLEHL